MIEHNLISKKDIIKDVITCKRNILSLNNNRNEIGKVERRNLKDRKFSVQDYKNRLKEKNISLMHNKDNHSFNIFESSKKQFNSSIFNISNNRNSLLVNKTSLFSSNPYKSINDDKIKNLGLSSAESSKLLLQNRNSSNLNIGIINL